MSRTRLLPLLVLPFLFSALSPAARADGERNPRENRTVKVVRTARAAVVSIKTPSRVMNSRYYSFLSPRRRENVIIPESALGSGVVFHPSGFVITNAHVISQADELLVDVPNGDGVVEFGAHPVAMDLPNDLAILRLLPAENETLPEFPYLRLEPSDDLMLGESVIAVGHPLRLGLTVTRGIISGLNRSLGVKGGVKFDDFIQVDAPINLGNSGGPLFDVTGRWIGVNTAIYKRGWNSTAEGIGFAIPTSRVRSLVAKAFRRRLVTGSWFGLELEEAEDGRAEISAVYPKGPAGGTSLRTGDVIVAVDGQSMTALYDVRMHMISLPLGSTVSLVAERAGQRLPPITVREEDVPTNALSLKHLGFQAEDADVEGVVITAVRPGSPAATVKLRPSDVVMALGPFRIKNSDDLLRFLQFVQTGDLVDVRVRRIVRTRGVGGRVADLKGSIEAE